MDYRIESRGEQWIVGLEREFRPDSAFREIPEFWKEYAEKGLHGVVPGALGVCFDEGGKTFRYLIGDFCPPDAAVPEGFVKRAVPAMDWACFECRGAMPGAIQALNREIYSVWLAEHPQYRPAAGMNIEWYDEGDMDAPDYRSGVMLPVRRADIER